MKKVKREDIYYSSADGKNIIHAILWQPESPKAVIQIVHGISEHIGRYAEYAEYLCSRGFAVVGEDHLGHGDTVDKDEDLCFFAEKDGWQIVSTDILELTSIAKAQFTDLPYFLLGHSMGSFLSRTIAITHSAEFDGLILSGTGHQNSATIISGILLAKFISLFIGPKGKSCVIDALAFSSYNRKFAPNRTRYDWISSCQNEVDKYVADTKCGSLATAGLFIDMLGGLAIIKNKRRLSRVRKDLPILIYSGELDPVGGMGKGVKKVYSLYKQVGIEDITLKLYEGGRHEMHNEFNKAKVMQNTADWIENKMLK